VSSCRVLRAQILEVLTRRHELQRKTVVAEPLPGWVRSIIEHVSLMSPAAHAVVLGAWADQFEVSFGLDASFDRDIEARLDGTAVELRGRGEQGEMAGGADERALPFLAVQGASVWGLGRFCEEHLERFIRQQATPFVERFLEFCARVPYFSHYRGMI